MKENNSRLLITVALCMVVALGWSYFFSPKPKPAPAGQAATQAPPKPQPTSGTPSQPAPTAPVASDVPRGTPAARRFPTKKVTLDSEKLHVVLTSDGAAVESLQLKGDKFKRQHEGKGDAPQVDLAEVGPGQLRPLSTTIRSVDGSSTMVPPDAAYEVADQSANKVVFRTDVDGVTVRKTLTLDPQNYRVDLKVDVAAAAGLNGQLVVEYAARTLAEGQGDSGWFSAKTHVPSQSICEVQGGKPERLAPGAKHPEWTGQNVGFVGIDEQYFLAALVPEQGAGATCRITADKTGTLSSHLILPVSAPAGTTVSKSMIVFAGPKVTDILTSVAPALKDSVDLGFWWLIARVLLEVMKFFYKVVPPHNWGVAIILLTLAVKVVTFPLQHKSMKSMQEMQRLQPQIDEMKKKYAGDQQRQNLEQMKLFKEHGVNPMGSCLPMLIQMPVWIALYTTLQVSVELYHEPFVGWIQDLTAKDPYYVLPVGMGITMFLTQYLTPSPMSNPQQKVMGYAMTAFFSFLMLNLPAGLTLYIFVNNLLSIAQQIYLRRTLRAPAAGATVTVSAKRA